MLKWSNNSDRSTFGAPTLHLSRFGRLPLYFLPSHTPRYLLRHTSSVRRRTSAFPTLAAHAHPHARLHAHPHAHFSHDRRRQVAGHAALRMGPVAVGWARGRRRTRQPVDAASDSASPSIHVRNNIRISVCFGINISICFRVQAVIFGFKAEVWFGRRIAFSARTKQVQLYLEDARRGPTGFSHSKQPVVPARAAPLSSRPLARIRQQESRQGDCFARHLQAGLSLGDHHCHQSHQVQDPLAAQGILRRTKEAVAHWSRLTPQRHGPIRPRKYIPNHLPSWVSIH